jgi:hypothetical protein
MVTAILASCVSPLLLMKKALQKEKDSFKYESHTVCVVLASRLTLNDAKTSVSIFPFGSSEGSGGAIAGTMAAWPLKDGTADFSRLFHFFLFFIATDEGRSRKGH